MCSLGEGGKGQQTLNSHSNGKGCADVHRSHKIGQRTKLDPRHDGTLAWRCRSVINSRHFQRLGREKSKG